MSMINVMEIIRLLERKSREERNHIISLLLGLFGHEYERHTYDTGENLIVNASKKPYIAIGSHFDAVPNSPGANDNASAVAVTLDLLYKFKEKPTKNIGVKGFFFDEEEKGLVGSREYIKKFGTDGMIGMYNMELVGAGDCAALWSVTEDDFTRLLTVFEWAAFESGVSTFRFPNIVANSADHVSFKNAGIKDAFTITMITRQDLLHASSYYEAFARGESVDKLWAIMSQAPVFKHYHKPTDTVENLSVETMQKVSNMIEMSIRKIDEQYS